MRLFRNGVRIRNVIRQAGANGNVTVRRVYRNDDDALFRAFARNRRTGETCQVQIRWDD